MKLHYFGHSFWKITSAGTQIVIDPFDDIGYPLPKNLAADVVVCSHDHHDHNNVSLIKGNPPVIKKPGQHNLNDVSIELIPVWHDEAKGTKRGINHMIKITAEGYTLIHCGDLGHLPDKEVIEKIKKPDFLLVPVGEIYTLSLRDVQALIDSIQPEIVFPMHYQTDVLKFRLGSLTAFLADKASIYHHDKAEIEITKDLTDNYRIIVLPWS